MASNPRLFPSSFFLLLILINGKMYVADAATRRTNKDDVRGLLILVDQYPHLLELVDDPCYPLEVTWIFCNDDASPRVTKLYLGDKTLYGTLPDFSSMDALEYIELDNNYLTGLIPEFLGTFPKLKELDLSNNRFSGQIPSSLMKNTNLEKDFSGNPSLSVSSSPSSSTTSERTTTSFTSETSQKKSNNMPIILGITIPAVAVIWIVIGVFAVMRQRERTEVAVRAAAAAQSNATNEANTPTEERPIHQQHTNNNS